MFEDIPPKNPTPPQNLPTEPADMFADIETNGAEPASALDAGILKKKPLGVQTLPSGMAPGETEAAVYPVKGPVLGKIIGFIVILVLAGAVGYGAWWAYSHFIAKNQPAVQTPESGAQTGQTTTPPVEEPAVTDENPEFPASTTTSTIEQETNNAEATNESVDSDKDGLTDLQEEGLGTNMNNPDTDADGLSDGDEVIIWKTDPLNKDTDGDSYLDGEEVKNGYNPLGPGKIIGVQNAIVPTTTATSSAATSTII